MCSWHVYLYLCVLVCVVCMCTCACAGKLFLLYSELTVPSILGQHTSALSVSACLFLAPCLLPCLSLSPHSHIPPYPPPPPSSPLPWCTQQYSFVNSAWTWFLWCFDKNGNSDHNCREWWGEGDLGRGASQTQEAWHSFFFQMCLDRRIRSQALPCCLAMVAELAASFSVQGTK